MEPNTPPRWIACGKTMKISRSERAVSKSSAECQFGVALSEKLTDSAYEVEFCFHGDCYYFAVGIAKSTIPLNDSLRRLNPGSAWFVLNKGFLCDGKTFPDDSLDPFGVGEKVKVSFDRERGRLIFLREDISVGIVDGLMGEDLRFCCYMDGTSASCSITFPSETEQATVEPSEPTQVPSTQQPDVDSSDPTPPPRQIPPKKTRKTEDSPRPATSEHAPHDTPNIPEHPAPTQPPEAPAQPESTEQIEQQDLDLLHQPEPEEEASAEIERELALRSVPAGADPAASTLARYEDLSTRTPQEAGAASDPPPARARAAGVPSDLNRRELYAPAPLAREASQPVTFDEHAEVDRHHFVVEEYKARHQPPRTPVSARGHDRAAAEPTPPMPPGRAPTSMEEGGRAGGGPSQDIPASDPPPERPRDAPTEMGGRELYPAVLGRQESLPVTVDEKGVVDEHHFALQQHQHAAQRRRQRDHDSAEHRGGRGGEEGGHAEQSRGWVEQTLQEVRGQREEISGRAHPAPHPPLPPSIPAPHTNGAPAAGAVAERAERESRECGRCRELEGVERLVGLMVDAARDRGGMPWREVAQGAEGGAPRAVASGLKEVWEHLAWLEGEHRRALERQRSATPLANGHGEADGGVRGGGEDGRLREELASSERERLSLMAELSRMTSRMGAMEASIISLQRQCFHKDEALRALNELDPDPDDNIWAHAGQELARMEASVRFLSEARGQSFRSPPRTDGFSNFGLLDMRGLSPPKHQKTPPRPRPTPPSGSVQSRASPGPLSHHSEPSPPERPHSRSHESNIPPAARPSMPVHPGHMSPHNATPPRQRISPGSDNHSRQGNTTSLSGLAMDAATAFMPVGGHTVGSARSSVDGDAPSELSSSKVSYASLC